MYKNIMERDTVNVHTYYRVSSTEFINILSVIITSRVKREIITKKLNRNDSYKQIFRYLSKYKKARVGEDGNYSQLYGRIAAISQKEKCKN